MDISDKHISVISEGEVNEICDPFFKATGINYFNYAVFYKTGYCFSLVTHAEWHKYYFSKKLYQNTKLLPSDQCYLISSYAPTIAFEAKSHFNINHFFEISKEYEDHYVLLSFGTANNNDRQISFYFSNQDLLKKFGLYFKDKAAKLIKLSNAKTNKILLPEYRQKGFAMIKDPYDQQRNILGEISPNKYFFNDQGQEVWLSKREIDCLTSFVKCRSAPEMAEDFNISVKTAESYIASAREKLNCTSRSELFDKLIEIGFIDLIF